jgi:ATP-dependent RNA helicase DHX8/PRP22
LEEGPGDILAFLTGQEEIESLERLIHERARLFPPESSKIWVTPIYSSLPSEQQMNAFKSAPAGTRKVLMGLNSSCFNKILLKRILFLPQIPNVGHFSLLKYSLNRSHPRTNLHLLPFASLLSPV